MASVNDTTSPMAVTLRVAAQKLGVSETHLRRLARNKTVRSVRAGRIYLFPLSALEAFLAGKPAA